MNELYKDKMLQKLAAFVGINLKEDLEVDSMDEMSDLYYAHEESGKKRDDIINFLSKAKKPTQPGITAKFIFKALKFNDKFYIQNLALIRATEWMRQEVYEKAKSSTIKKENMVSKYVIIDTKPKLKEVIGDFIKKANSPFGQFVTPPISDSVSETFPLVVAAASGNTITIPYDKELSDDSLQVDITKSPMKFLTDGIRIRFKANFNDDKEYFVVILKKPNKFEYAIITDNEAVIKTKNPDDYRSDIVVFIANRRTKK